MNTRTYTIRVLGPTASSDSWYTITVDQRTGREVSRRMATGDEIRRARRTVDL
jgi:hypothetical protein